MNSREKITERLNSLGIKYELFEHKAAYTIEEYDSLGIDSDGEICKNLFLRDYKGKRHMLVVIRGEKHADLALIRNEIDSSRLSFASDARLEKYLDVKQGSVSVLGVINDETDSVEVYFDEDLKQCKKIGFHPNDNTQSIFMSFDDVVKYVESTGHIIRFIKV